LPDHDRVRIEIGFEGGAAMSVLVPSSTVDDLERAMGGEDGAISLEAEDGFYTFAVRRIVYVKRFMRETRVGFGALTDS
jgi:hypothetical protein